jgi:hypothetical protein
VSLAIAIPAGVVSAVAYGVATAVQHGAMQSDAAAHGGLRVLLRDARWWLSVGADTIGLGLQLLALATGPVVLVQPLFVLCLPVALPVRARLVGGRVSRREYRLSLLLGIGLAGFFVLAGSPGAGRELSTVAAGWIEAVALVAGGLLLLASRPLGPTRRAVTVSSVSGAWFGVEAVLVNAVATAWRHAGLHAFERAAGLVPLAGLVVLGLGAFALTQVAFGLGSLGASFPAMLVTDPLVAVLLGALLLGEGIRSGPTAVVGYVAALAVVGFATVRLASPLLAPGNPVDAGVARS